MIYDKGKLIDGKLVIVDKKEIDQTKLTSDCWLIQFSGLTACKECEYKNTDECGGGETLKKLTNKK